MTKTFVSNKSVIINAAHNLLGQGLPLVVAFYCIPHLITALGVERFGFLTLIWVVVGYLSIFDLGLGLALTKLVAEKIGRGEHDRIPALFWTAMWLMCGLGLAGFLIAEALIPLLFDNMFHLPPELKQEAQSALSVAALSLPFVIVSTGSRGVLEAYQRFDLVNWFRIPLGLFNFAAPLLVANYLSNDLSVITAVLVFARLIFLCGTMWLCFKIEPALWPLQKIQRALLKPLFGFGGWMTLTNLMGPMMVYLDRFVIGALVSMSAVAYYVTPYEAITKLWIIPGALIGALFSAFSSNLAHHIGRTVNQFQKVMDGIFLLMLPITMLVMAYAHEGLTLWLGHDFAVHAVSVFQILAIGVFINSIGRVSSVFIMAAGRPDIPAYVFMLELPIYLFSLWYMLGRWGVEGAAIAWVARIVLDNVAMFIGCAYIVPLLKPAMWRGIAMSMFPCLLLSTVIVVTGLTAQIIFTVAALLIFVWGAYWFRQHWRGKLLFSSGAKSG
jgi:O-antigen/teichoic acid export membrane protein